MKNTYETNGEVTKIYFRNCNDFMLIDTKDLEQVSKHTWYKDNWGYGHSMVNGKHKRCHNFLMGKAPEGFVTDHINRNRLDNRRSNLRFCTYLESTLNTCTCNYQKKFLVRHREGKRFDAYTVEFKNNENRTVYIGSYRTLDTATKIGETAIKMFEEGTLTPFQIKKLRNAQ